MQKISKWKQCGDRDEIEELSQMNAANWEKMNTRADITGWEGWSTGNCERDWSLSIMTKGIMHKPETIIEKLSGSYGRVGRSQTSFIFWSWNYR